MAVLSPFDPAQPFPLQDPNAPPASEVQAPIPEPAPAPVAPMVPPPVDASLQGAPGAPQQAQGPGGPLPWPDPAWMQQDGYQGQDVPVVQDQVPAGLNPNQEPPATTQAGPEAMAALEAQPRPAPQQPVNPDPVLAQADQNAQDHSDALAQLTQAETQRNDFLASSGVQIASDAAIAQGKADKIYMQAQEDAKAKRAQLDKEAMAIANQQIDPRRAWHDASFGAKLAIGIATIVQGMVTKGNVGASPVVAMVNAICEQDMKAQEEALTNRTGALSTRRGLLADDVAAGRDILDFQYKSLNAAYAMAENQIKAYALKWDNPVINAQAQEQLAKINDARLKMGMDYHQQTVENGIKKQQVGIQSFEARTGRMNAETAALAQKAKGSENTTAQQRYELEREKYERGKIIRGFDGRPIKEAQTEDEAKEANIMLDGQKQMDILYKRGRELFKSDYAMPATQRRDQQATWAKDWSEARRHASGDHSAPNQYDSAAWGVEAGRIFGNNMDIIDEAYKNARNTGLGKLRRSGIAEDELTKEGLIDPPEAPTPGVVEKRFFQDESGVNTEGRGSPLSAEENAAEQRRRDKFEQTRTDPETWKRRRYENNLHVSQRAQGPLPWPDVGTGPID